MFQFINWCILYTLKWCPGCSKRCEIYNGNPAEVWTIEKHTWKFVLKKRKNWFAVRMEWVNLWNEELMIKIKAPKNLKDPWVLIISTFLMGRKGEREKEREREREREREKTNTLRWIDTEGEGSHILGGEFECVSGCVCVCGCVCDCWHLCVCVCVCVCVGVSNVR